MSIRAGKLEDINYIIEINNLCRKQTYEPIFGKITESPNHKSEYKKREKRVLDKETKFFYVSQKADRVIGYIYARKNQDTNINCEIEIFAIYVNPEYQNEGIGGNLFDFLLQNIKGSRYNQIYLWVLEPNFNARAFYEKNGGRQAGSKINNIYGKDIKKLLYMWDV